METQNETNGARFVRATGGEISKWQIFVEYVQMFIKINVIIIASIFRFFFPRRDTNWKEEIVLITGSAGYVGKNLAAQVAMKGSIAYFKLLHFAQKFWAIPVANLFDGCV